MVLRWDRCVACAYRKVENAGVSPRLHATSALYRSLTSAVIRCNADVLNGLGVRSAVAAIDAAQRLRGDAVETVMQTADFRNRHDATG